MDAARDGRSNGCIGMRQVVGLGDRFTEGGNSVGECWASHCNQWGVCADFL